jgi:hypothetical protein
LPAQDVESWYEETVESSQFDPRLQPELREAAETLEQALTEACAAKAAQDADTGELIKVEEMLALAGDAARRAIAIRRKARQQAEAAAALGEPIAPAPDLAESASHRLFDDKRGVRWDVWAVYPEARSAQLSALPGSFQSGWLVFESGTEKRRLSPIPSNWQTVPPSELERLCERAETASRRRRPQGGRPGEEDAPPHTE